MGLDGLEDMWKGALATMAKTRRREGRILHSSGISVRVTVVVVGGGQEWKRVEREESSTLNMSFLSIDIRATAGPRDF